MTCFAVLEGQYRDYELEGTDRIFAFSFVPRIYWVNPDGSHHLLYGGSDDGRIELQPIEWYQSQSRRPEQYWRDAW